MATLLERLDLLSTTWDANETDPLVAVELAIGIFQSTRTILEPSSMFDNVQIRAYARAINHICRQRAHGPPMQPDASAEIEAIRSQKAMIRVFMYIVECQLRLALVQGKEADALNDGTRIGHANARVTHCVFDAPNAPEEAISLALKDVQTSGVVRDEAHNMMAFVVCFKQGEEGAASGASWAHIEACEVLTAHAWASVELETLVESFPIVPVFKESTDDDGVRAWHKKVCDSQHTDEFMVEITDTMLKTHMYECEALEPETMRAFRESKPRRGYHWYTRLRVSREGDGCDELYKACSVRTTQMPDSLRALSMLSYIEYYMRHAGVESWTSLCFIDAHYPKHALDALAFRQNLPLGYPKMPPMLYRTQFDTFCVVTFDHVGRTMKISTMESMHEAFASWCRVVMETTGGFLAPRVSCAGMIDHVLGVGDTDDFDGLDLVEEMRHAPTFEIM